MNVSKGSLPLIDPALPGLATALDRTAMRQRLAPLARGLGAGDAADEEAPAPAAGQEWRVVAVDILKHKPGHRCALAYKLSGPAGRRRLFAKAFAGERGATILVTMSRIAEAASQSLLVPRPLGYFADLKLLVTEYLDGIPLAAALYEGASDQPLRRMAAALHALHACEASFTRRWSAPREVANTADWLNGLEFRSPQVASRARVRLEALSRWAAELEEPPERPVHRDFYADQVWDCGGRTALLDLDDARCGDPALDVGNFLAHLTLRSLQFPDVARGCARASRAFPEAYETLCAGRDWIRSLRSRSRFYEAASLLRLCGVYGRRERWADRLPPRLLEACEAVLHDQGVKT